MWPARGFRCGIRRSCIVKSHQPNRTGWSPATWQRNAATASTRRGALLPPLRAAPDFDPPVGRRVRRKPPAPSVAPDSPRQNLNKEQSLSKVRSGDAR